MIELTPQRERFCQEYIVDLNGKQAAIRAGYSDNTAKEQASRMLADEDVQQRIAELQQDRIERTQVTADAVVMELAKIGFATVKDYIETDNTVKDLSAVEDHKAAAVESIQVDESTVGGVTSRRIKLKMHSKIAALTGLGRHLGIFEKDNAQQTDSMDLSKLDDTELAMFIQLRKKAAVK